MTQPDLGTKLRTLRSERGHSIAEVAERTGISASFLSLVENGRSDIAIGRLVRLIEFYEVGLATLFPEKPQAEIDVVRRDEYVHLVSGGEGLDLLLLSRDGDRQMTPFVAEYTEGGGMSEPTPYEGETSSTSSTAASASSWRAATRSSSSPATPRTSAARPAARTATPARAPRACWA